MEKHKNVTTKHYLASTFFFSLALSHSLVFVALYSYFGEQHKISTKFPSSYTCIRLWLLLFRLHTGIWCCRHFCKSTLIVQLAILYKHFETFLPGAKVKYTTLTAYVCSLEMLKCEYDEVDL